MPNMRLVVLNGSAGAFVDVLATRWTRRCEVIEDESVAVQGLDYKIADDGSASGFTTTFDLAASTQPIILGNLVAHGNAKGPVLAAPQQNDSGSLTGIRAAGKLISLRSKTATGTTARVSEFE